MRVRGWSLTLGLLLAVPGLAGAEDEIHGNVTALDAPAARLEMSGVTVAASNALVQSESQAALKLADLKIGDRVEVYGAFAARGVLAAARIRRTLRGGDKIRGRNERTDAANRALTIGGITVKVPVNARLEDSNSRVLPLEQFSTNRVLECVGTWTGTNEFTATQVGME